MKVSEISLAPFFDSKLLYGSLKTVWNITLDNGEDGTPFLEQKGDHGENNKEIFKQICETNKEIHQNVQT